MSIQSAQNQPEHDVRRDFLLNATDFLIWQSGRRPTSYGPPPPPDDEERKNDPRHEWCGFLLQQLPDGSWICPQCDFFRKLHENKIDWWSEETVIAYRRRLESLGASPSVSGFLASQPVWDMLYIQPTEQSDATLVDDIAWARSVLPSSWQ